MGDIASCVCASPPQLALTDETSEENSGLCVNADRMAALRQSGIKRTPLVHDAREHGVDTTESVRRHLSLGCGTRGAGPEWSSPPQRAALERIAA